MKSILSFVFTILLFVSCNTPKVVSAPQAPNLPAVPTISQNYNPTYWQQHVDYTMDIDLDVNTYQYKGSQNLVYTNNSPDVLKKVFYHLYFNAFQPGSEMDVRSQNVPDPDARVGNRISELNPNEIGYIHVQSLKQNGIDL